MPCPRPAQKQRARRRGAARRGGGAQRALGAHKGAPSPGRPRTWGAPLAAWSPPASASAPSASGRPSCPVSAPLLFSPPRGPRPPPPSLRHLNCLRRAPSPRGSRGTRVSVPAGGRGGGAAGSLCLRGGGGLCPPEGGGGREGGAWPSPGSPAPLRSRPGWGWGRSWPAVGAGQNAHSQAWGAEMVHPYSPHTPPPGAQLRATRKGWGAAISPSASWSPHPDSWVTAPPPGA